MQAFSLVTLVSAMLCVQQTTGHVVSYQSQSRGNVEKFTTR